MVEDVHKIVKDAIAEHNLHHQRWFESDHSRYHRSTSLPLFTKPQVGPSLIQTPMAFVPLVSLLIFQTSYLPHVNKPYPERKGKEYKVKEHGGHPPERDPTGDVYRGAHSDVGNGVRRSWHQGSVKSSKE